MPTKTRETEQRADATEAGAPREMTKVTINMPVKLHRELQERAHQRGISVTELMRRAVALDKLVFEDGATVTITEHGKEKVLHLL